MRNTQAAEGKLSALRDASINNRHLYTCAEELPCLSDLGGLSGLIDNLVGVFFFPRTDF